MKPGDVVLVRFPQADLQAGKLRPALVVAIAPGYYADVLLALITSRLYQEASGLDEVIETTDPDFAESGLKVRSVVRLSRLASVEPVVIQARLGEISAKRLTAVKKHLVEWLRK